MRFFSKNFLSKFAAAVSFSLVLFAAHGGGAESLSPLRTVEGNRLISPIEPVAAIELPKSIQYVGGDRWILNGIADCEVHVFVEADEAKRVARLYVLQFESYLPSRPELHSRNADTQTARLGNLDFLVKARFGSSEEEPRPGSDTEHIQMLLKRGGYVRPKEMMNVRFIHFLDERRRQELLIFYAEDLAQAGSTTERLLPGGADQAKWPAIAEALVQRATQAIVLRAPR